MPLICQMNRQNVICVKSLILLPLPKEKKVIFLIEIFTYPIKDNYNCF